MSLNFGNMWSKQSQKKNNSVLMNRTMRPNRNMRPKHPKMSGRINKVGMGTKAYWGTPTWFLFHSLAEKANSEKYKKHYMVVWQFIKDICYALPCPFCKEHASSYVNGISLTQINTKEKLIDVLFKFHNDVNLRTGSRQMTKEILIKYKSSNLNNILKLFLDRFFVSYIGRRHFDDWIKNKTKDKTYIFWDFYRNNLI